MYRSVRLIVRIRIFLFRLRHSLHFLKWIWMEWLLLGNTQWALADSWEQRRHNESRNESFAIFWIVRVPMEFHKSRCANKHFMIWILNIVSNVPWLDSRNKSIDLKVETLDLSATQTSPKRFAQFLPNSSIDSPLNVFELFQLTKCGNHFSMPLQPLHTDDPCNTQYWPD